MFFTKSCGAALRAGESAVPQGPTRIILCKMQHVKNKKEKVEVFSESMDVTTVIVGIVCFAVAAVVFFVLVAAVTMIQVAVTKSKEVEA